jgi:hypothetical protein
MPVRQPQAADPSADEFDQVNALLRSANQALKKAMDANPVVARPSDVKTLVDAAANAMKLVGQCCQPQLKPIFKISPSDHHPIHKIGKVRVLGLKNQ